MENLDWMPAKGGHVALSERDLAKIGLAVVYEAQAKSVAAAILKALTRQDSASWVEVEKMQFSQILKRTVSASLIDDELGLRIRDLEKARIESHDLRHMVVHSAWGVGGDDGLMAFDYRRQKELGRSEIDSAMNGCAELKRAAHWAAYRVAQLIECNVLTERPSSEQGIGIHTETRLVRL